MVNRVRSVLYASGSLRESRIDLVDDEPRALLPALGPAEIHREGHIEDLEHRGGQSDMKRQAFAAPGFFFVGKKAGDQVLTTLKPLPALLLDP